MPDAGSSDSPSWLHVGKLVELEHFVENHKFRRALLETPSGFAVFDVHEDLFEQPEFIWSYFTDERNACKVVLAVGFTKVEDKSVARDTNYGPGKELSRLIKKRSAYRNDLIVQDAQLKCVIEANLEVKCSTDMDYLGDLMWGLKFVLHSFIPQEDNLANDYYVPLCEGLQNALKRHNLDLSQGEEVDRKFLHMLGYVEQLRLNQKLMLTMFHMSCYHLIHGIGKIIKCDDTIYRNLIAKILAGDFSENEFIQSGCNWPKNAREIIQTIRETIISDHQWVQTVLTYLDTCDDQIECALTYLKVRLVGSPNDPSIQLSLQTIQADLRLMQPKEGILDDWLVKMNETFEMRGDLIEEGVDELNGTRHEDGLFYVVEDTDTQVDKVETTRTVEEETSPQKTFEMRVGGKDDLNSVDGMRDGDVLLDVKEYYKTPPQEEPVRKIKEDTAPHVDETAPQVELGEEPVRKIEEDTAPHVDETGPQVELEEAVNKVDEKPAPHVDETAPQDEETVRKVEEETDLHVSKGTARDGDGNIPKASRFSKWFPLPSLGISIGSGIMLAMVLSLKATKSQHSKNTC